MKMFDENGQEWDVGYDGDDYISGYDDGEGYDPIMGDEEDWVETDDEWLDDFQGEEDWG
jgi:hypothetical protein